MRAITEINLHCAATKPQWLAGRPAQEKVAEIKKWHVVDNGWDDIAYHFIIDRDGSVVRGRKPEKAGAFEPACNARAIGVCLIGGYGSNATDQFEQHYTPEQDASLRTLLRVLQYKYPDAKKITGHNDYRQKGCPGFKVDRWLARKPPRTFAESGTAAGGGAAVAAGSSLAAVEVVKQFSEATTEVKAAVVEVQAQRAEVKADPADPLKWVLLGVIVAGAAFALYRRWADWKAGRQ